MLCYLEKPPIASVEEGPFYLPGAHGTQGLELQAAGLLSDAWEAAP